MGAADGVAPQQLLGVGVDDGDLVLSDQRVAADQMGRGHNAVPTTLRRVLGIAPQRVVLAVGPSHMPKGVLVGNEVVRRLRVRLWHTDAAPQLGYALVGDRRHLENVYLPSRAQA